MWTVELLAWTVGVYTCRVLICSILCGAKNLKIKQNPNLELSTSKPSPPSAATLHQPSHCPCSLDHLTDVDGTARCCSVRIWWSWSVAQAWAVMDTVSSSSSGSWQWMLRSQVAAMDAASLSGLWSWMPRVSSGKWLWMPWVWADVDCSPGRHELEWATAVDGMNSSGRRCG